MTKTDYDAYFGRTQLGTPTASMASSSDCWGHTYYVIPAGSSFLALPPGVDSQRTLKGIAFEALQADRNAEQLFVEMFFHKGHKFTNVWAVSGQSRTLLTPTPVKEKDYEYEMYKRATALYPACPSDGYELLRFGRILSPSPTLGMATGGTPPPVDASPQGNPRSRDAQNPRATWMRVTFAAGREGYIDVSPDAISKLSTATIVGLLTHAIRDDLAIGNGAYLFVLHRRHQMRAAMPASVESDWIDSVGEFERVHLVHHQVKYRRVGVGVGASEPSSRKKGRANNHAQRVNG
ncbi:hypothetical protein [Caballeronia sp. Lep1P3]|uniref:hypothetical protein n=1 Tax=Caballeronia sp. Lep1P3 TaxID=2878150 RepID=UPI00351D2B64